MDSHSAQLEALVIGKAANSFSRSAPKRTRGFLVDIDKAEYIVTVLVVTCVGAKKYSPEKMNILKPREQKNKSKADHPEGEDNFDDKKATVVLSRLIEKEQVEEKVSFQWKSITRIQVGYCYKMKLYFTTLLAYLLPYMIPKNDLVGIFFTAADLKCPRSLISMVATLSQRRELLPEA